MTETASPMHLQAAGTAQAACDTCGALFTPKRSWSRFCTTRCRNAFHGAEARREAIKASATDMYLALRIIARSSCERLTTGPGSCWSQPGLTPEAEFTADQWCRPCVALAAIHDLKPPVEPKALLEKPKA